MNTNSDNLTGGTLRKGARLCRRPAAAVAIGGAHPGAVRWDNCEPAAADPAPSGAQPRSAL